MKKRYVKCVIVGGIVATVLLGLGYGYYRLNEALRCDYYTLDVIVMVEDYVESHDGKWPSNWNDLEGTDRYRGRGLEMSAYLPYVSISFTLTSDQILEEPDLIYQAVLPSSGEYVCYPDARLHLEHILETIRREYEPNAPEPTR